MQPRITSWYVTPFSYPTRCAPDKLNPPGNERNQYIGLSNLDAAPYQLVYQLKILSTALFSVFLFRKPNLSSLKWLSLVLLAVGVAIVQLDAERGGGGGGGGGKDKGRRDKVEGDGEQDRLKGFAAVAAASLSSGLAGCWFERALTTSTKDCEEIHVPSSS